MNDPFLAAKKLGNIYILTDGEWIESEMQLPYMNIGIDTYQAGQHGNRKKVLGVTSVHNLYGWIVLSISNAGERQTKMACRLRIGQ